MACIIKEKGYGIYMQELDEEYINYILTNSEYLPGPEHLHYQWKTKEEFLHMLETCPDSADNPEFQENLQELIIMTADDNPIQYIAEILNSKFDCAGFSGFQTNEENESALAYVRLRKEDKKPGDNSLSKAKKDEIFADVQKALGWEIAPAENVEIDYYDF